MPYHLFLKRNDGTWRHEAMYADQQDAVDDAAKTGIQWELYFDEQLIAFSNGGKLLRKPRRHRRRKR